VVVKHFFAADVSGADAIELSHEHTALDWLDLEAAHERLTYPDEQAALREVSWRMEGWTG